MRGGHVKDGVHRRSRRWPGEQVALQGSAADVGQEGALLGGLHALGRHFQAARLGKINDRLDDRAAFLPGAGPADER